MSEKFNFQNGNDENPKQKETLEQKMERLKLILEKSLEIALDDERDINEGLINIGRKRPDGRIETIHELIVLEINENGPNLAGINKEGYFTASATMLWTEIIDAKFEY